MKPSEMRVKLSGRPSAEAVRQGQAFRDTPLHDRLIGRLCGLVRAGLQDHDGLRQALLSRLSTGSHMLATEKRVLLHAYDYDGTDYLTPSQLAIVHAVCDFAAEIDGVLVDDLDTLTLSPDEREALRELRTIGALPVDHFHPDTLNALVAHEFAATGLGMVVPKEREDALRLAELIAAGQVTPAQPKETPP